MGGGVRSLPTLTFQEGGFPGMRLSSRRPLIVPSILRSCGPSSQVALVEEPACQRRCGFNLLVGKIPWRRKRQPTPAFLPGESHGQGSLVGSSPWGRTVR